jgi:PAS domain S-box-containing protein
MNEERTTPFDQAKKLVAKRPDDIVALYSFDDRCCYASPSHETILGISPTEMIGKKWTEVVAPEDHDHADLAGNDAFLNGQSIEFGLSAVTRSGSRVPLRGVARITTDPITRTGYLLFQASVVSR